MPCRVVKASNLIYQRHSPLLCKKRCGPCKAIAPIFKELSEEFDAQFIKVDVDENPEAAQKFGVSAMPTFVFIKGGEVVDRLMGANAARLKELIAEWSL